MTNERLKVLLANALEYLEEATGLNIMDGDLEDIIGITQEEYKEVIKGGLI